MTDPQNLAVTKEVGSLGVYHLKRLWSRTLAARAGVSVEPSNEEDWDRLVLDALGLGLQQTLKYLFSNGPSFSEFEEWILATAGKPSPRCVARLNADITSAPSPESTRDWLSGMDAREAVLTPEALLSWEEQGYVVLANAAEESSRAAAETAIWNQVGADPDSPETWYKKGRESIMVEFIQHPAFDAIRNSPRIHKAFAQIWGTSDLWVSADRCGFHVPQREDYPFPGPDLHWDLDFSKPLRFGTQGILYLTDTPPEQGALTLVPGFHKRLSDWLKSLPKGSDPQCEDLHALGSVPIGGKAGDLIIWNQALPHGSRPNLGTRPRIVQYLNRYPGRQRPAPL